jgi:RTX calcium-binding nonapeptide repeat (4 copies)/WD40-like Beta Propeller Repeat
LYARVVILVLVAASAVASASARPARQLPTAFRGCYDVAVGARPTEAPDGRIVYAYGNELHSVRTDGTQDRILLRTANQVRSPAISPNGQQIAFDKGTTSHEIWLMNHDGSGAHYVTTGTTPAFAPDGTHLAIGGVPTQSGTIALDVIGLDGAGRRTVAVDAAPLPEPAWSPDGTKIVFNSPARVPFDEQKLKIVNSDGTNERPFAGGGESASWSPDGSAVAYSYFSRYVPKRLYLISADGTRDRPLGPQGHEFDAVSPAWSGDGKQLTFVLAPSDFMSSEGVLWRIDANGRGRHPIAADCRFGTGSADHIRGSQRSDRIFGLEGNDTIDVRGGGRDVVNCGPGRDTVLADRRDVIARNCERVRRSR